MASCVPNSVTNSSKLITGIKHKVLYFFYMRHGEAKDFLSQTSFIYAADGALPATLFIRWKE